MMLLITRIAAIAGGAFAIFVVLAAGDWSNIALVVLGLAFTLWAALPFGVTFHQARRFAHAPQTTGSPVITRSAAAAALLLLATLTITISAFVIYWGPFIAKVNTDAQDGIILFILPLYQLVFVGLAVGAAHLLSGK